MGEDIAWIGRERSEVGERDVSIGLGCCRGGRGGALVGGVRGEILRVGEGSGRVGGVDGGEPYRRVFVRVGDG